MLSSCLISALKAIGFGSDISTSYHTLFRYIFTAIMLDMHKKTAEFRRGSSTLKRKLSTTYFAVLCVKFHHSDSR